MGHICLGYPEYQPNVYGKRACYNDFHNRLTGIIVLDEHQWTEQLISS